MEVLALLLSGSMNSGGGYSVVKMQFKRIDFVSLYLVLYSTLPA
jgi:hypothetical protein